MAVPTIPSAISLGHVRVEFIPAGSNSNILITSYYAGNGNVASGTTNATSVVIPSSGQIAFSNFSGASAAVSLPVSALARNPYNYTFGATANAFMRWNSSGTCDISNYSPYTWLLSGSASSYDVSYEKTGGIYSGTLSGMTNLVWYVMSTTRTAYLLDPIAGAERTVIATIKIKYNANSTIIDSNSCTWTAWGEATGCPTCCFTPDTLITMANGSYKRIVDIIIGDEIKSINGNKKITEIITRDYRKMFAIEFGDGRILNSSEDHPLFVIGKGYASINPVMEYKEMGIPAKLDVGDRVLGEDGKENEILSIKQIYYPWTVYTFKESEFYANGILVF